jgi:hypothetical protein
MSTVSYCEYVGKGVEEARWGHSFVFERHASRMSHLEVLMLCWLRTMVGSTR